MDNNKEKDQEKEVVSPKRFVVTVIQSGCINNVEDNPEAPAHYLDLILTQRKQSTLVQSDIVVLPEDWIKGIL